MSEAFDDLQRNHIDGEWHRIKTNEWMYTDLVNRITTWCGKTADDSEGPLPYMVIGRISYGRIKGEKDLYTSNIDWPDKDCEACAKAAWQHDYDTLMKKKP